MARGLPANSDTRAEQQRPDRNRRHSAGDKDLYRWLAEHQTQSARLRAVHHSRSDPTPSALSLLLHAAATTPTTASRGCDRVGCASVVYFLSQQIGQRAFLEGLADFA